MNKNIQFGKASAEFYNVLSQRVNQYFQETNNISRYANAEMIIRHPS